MIWNKTEIYLEGFLRDSVLASLQDVYVWMCEQSRTNYIDQREETTAGQNLKINSESQSNRLYHRFYRAEHNTVLKQTSGQICLINKKAAFLVIIKGYFCKVIHFHGGFRGFRSQHWAKSKGLSQITPDTQACLFQFWVWGRISYPKRMTSDNFRVMYVWSGMRRSFTKVWQWKKINK